jgi:diguanylate cyclase (GGDEF)-like protein
MRSRHLTPLDGRAAFAALVGVLLATTLIAALSLTAIRTRSLVVKQQRLVVLDMRLYVAEQSAARADTAVNGGDASAIDVISTSDHLNSELNRLRELDLPLSERRSLTALVASYNAAVDRSAQLAGTDLAFEGARDLTSSYHAFAGSLGVLSTALSAEVARRDRATTIAIWVILIVSGLVNCLLLGVFHRARRRDLLRISLEGQVREREFEANHDELTGLLNRRGFLTALDAEISAAPADETALAAVLMVDLDGFKAVNDTLGHGAGDLLLRELGPRVLRVLRDGDVLARLGGDEFALLLPRDRRLTPDAVTTLAERVRAAIAEPLAYDGLTLQVRASVGIALFPDHGRDADALLKHADVAMYHAKRSRSGVSVYDHEADENSRERLALAGDLRVGIPRDELVLHYQPKADLETGVVTSAEALVRWRHPERGLLAPPAFLPVAEQAGLMGELTRWVLEHAIAQCATWRQEGIELALSVNLSPSDLLDEGLVDTVAELLTRHGVQPAALNLEITETVMMSEPVRSRETITALAELGVRVSLDDFGTGYSSLSHLRGLAVDEIKIDRSFVMGLVPGSEDAVIVSSTIGLARGLGLRVVAEGVESADVLEELSGYGCHEAQGYYVSRPVPAPDLTAWLLARPERLTPADAA